MSTNISKLHREDLLDKIQQICTYIASAPQDQNTGNLLQYLDELVKDVKAYSMVHIGKKINQRTHKYWHQQNFLKKTTFKLS